MGKKAERAKDRKKKKQQRKSKQSFSWDDSQDLNGQLRRLGLCTKDITGDGNCLFRSLSDQYYGRDSQHKAIRQEVCQFLQEHEEEYKFFVEDDVPFDKHVSDMKCNGTFGGNMELAAFAKLKGIDIKVYQPGLIYVINGVDSEDNNDEEGEEEEEKQILHIAYHSWEHYSSIRNIGGPDTGPPEIKVNLQEDNQDNSDNDDDDNDDDKEPVDNERDSKEKVVSSAFPSVSPRRIKRLLIKNKGNVDKVIDLLYEEENKAEQEKNKNAIEDQPVEEPAKSNNTQITHHDESTQPDNPLESSQPEESIEQVDNSLNTEPVEDIKDDSKPNDMESKKLDESLDDSDKQVDTNNAKTEASKEKEGEDKDIDKQEPSQNKETETPKKPNARQRKLDKKKAQKELQEKKKQEKAARIAKRVHDTSSHVDSTETSTKKLPSAMKELHI